VLATACVILSKQIGHGGVGGVGGVGVVVVVVGLASADDDVEQCAIPSSIARWLAWCAVPWRVFGEIMAGGERGGESTLEIKGVEELLEEELVYRADSTLCRGRLEGEV